EQQEEQEDRQADEAHHDLPGDPTVGRLPESPIAGRCLGLTPDFVVDVHGDASSTCAERTGSNCRAGLMARGERTAAGADAARRVRPPRRGQDRHPTCTLITRPISRGTPSGPERTRETMPTETFASAAEKNWASVPIRQLG